MRHVVARELPASFFAGNRRKLEGLLGESFLALLAAGVPPNRTADEAYPFFANRNFFYLAGIEQEQAILLLFKKGAIRRDILFIPAPDPMQERWTGRRLRKEDAAARSGMVEIEYLDGFDGILGDLLSQVPDSCAWLDASDQNAQAASLRAKLAGLKAESETADLAGFMASLRMIKEPEETALIEEAAAITGRGIEAILPFLRPGCREYHAWNAFRSSLAMEGCLEPAFPSIVAAGENLFCLHHMNPTGLIQDGDLVQVDVGASCGGLCADISRVFPASGRFSPRQLEIYQLVRHCQDAAFTAIKPGASLTEVNERCRDAAREGLAGLGLMDMSGNAGDYFWHGVSHHLGMDVHDVSKREAVLQPGMVLTVEPGVYVENWRVGLRIEDDVLVTADGCRLLSAGIPREAAQIEALMEKLL